MSQYVRPTVDEYAMILAYAASLRSEDPSRRVGAVALNAENRVLATAYNGLPRKFVVRDTWWEDDERRRKFVVHAEVNLCSLTRRGEVHTVASTTIPCGSCALSLVAHGVRRVVFCEKYPRDESGQHILDHYGIALIHVPFSVVMNYNQQLGHRTDPCFIFCRHELQPTTKTTQ